MLADASPYAGCKQTMHLCETMAVSCVPACWHAGALKRLHFCALLTFMVFSSTGDCTGYNTKYAAEMHVASVAGMLDTAAGIATLLWLQSGFSPMHDECGMSEQSP